MNRWISIDGSIKRSRGAARLSWACCDVPLAVPLFSFADGFGMVRYPNDSFIYYFGSMLCTFTRGVPVVKMVADSVMA